MVADGRDDFNPNAVKITAEEIRRSLRESIIVFVFVLLSLKRPESNCVAQ